MKRPMLLEFQCMVDHRGNLAFLEELKDVPFEIKRVYWITHIPEQQVRGGHAHKTDHQVIICIKGNVQVLLESKDGELFEADLKNENQGVYIPPMWWGKMVFSQDAILLGLSSEEFSEDDYIRNKEEF